MSSSSSGTSESTSPPECPPPCESCYGGERPQLPSTGSNPGVDPASLTPRASGGSPSWNAFNQSFNASLSYDSLAGGTDVGFGRNWMAPGLVGLSGTGSSGPATGKLTYNQRPGRTLAFNPTSTPGSYRAAYFIKSQLSWDSGSSKYNMLEEKGSERIFDATGKIFSRRDAGGNAMNFSYNGTEIDEVSITDGADHVKTVYAWSGGSPSRVSSAVVWVKGREVRKTVYDYEGDQLLTIMDYLNSTPGTGTPDWGSTPVSAWRFSYHSGTGLLRHIINPEKFRQMANNGIDPTDPLLSSSILNDYAVAEYEYDTNGKVSTLYTHGRRYTYGFAQTPSSHSPGGSLNVWTHKTEVTMPDGSVRTYYFNKGQQLMLEKVEVITPSKIWYPLAQVFDSSSASIILSAKASAISGVNEGSASLFTLASAAGRITEYGYDGNGYLAYTGLRKGTGGTLNKLRSLTYDVIGAGGKTIYYVASETIYRSDGSGDGITTTYYPNNIHPGTFQVEQWQINYPTVGVSENGLGTGYSRFLFYDTCGFLVQELDERGTWTGYQYDVFRGSALKQVVQDIYGLNLITDYTVDDEGRRTLTLGPAHDVDVGGTATNIRTALWTYYLDADGKTVSFRGYQTTAGTPADQIVGPVTVTEPNLAPPGGGGGSYPGWRQSSAYDAKWTGTGIPDPAETYPQSDWVRWKLSLSDEAGETKEEWTYFDIPSSGSGLQSSNYGKKLFEYDSAGRLDTTTCAGGTIDKTGFNAMGWAITEALGTSAGLVLVETKEYDDNGNLTLRTKPVDSNSAHDRVTVYRYDWRDRLEETETTVEKDGGGSWTLLDKLAYDNRDLPISQTCFYDAVPDPIRTSHQTKDFDVLGRQYRSTVYGVEADGDLNLNPQVSNTYYEPGGLVAREAPAGSALFTATLHDSIGRASKVFQAYEPTFTPGDNPSDVSNAMVMEQREFAWDEASDLLSIITRLRFDDATEDGELQDPSTAPEARASFVASYADPIGRVVATASYGAGASATWTRSATVPSRSDTVLVTSIGYDDAGNA